MPCLPRRRAGGSPVGGKAAGGGGVMGSGTGNGHCFAGPAAARSGVQVETAKHGFYINTALLCVKNKKSSFVPKQLLLLLFFYFFFQVNKQAKTAKASTTKMNRVRRFQQEALEPLSPANPRYRNARCVGRQAGQRETGCTSQCCSGGEQTLEISWANFGEFGKAQ